jgi:hypothetical protein
VSAFLGVKGSPVKSGHPDAVAAGSQARTCHRPGDRSLPVMDPCCTGTVPAHHRPGAPARCTGSVGSHAFAAMTRHRR